MCQAMKKDTLITQIQSAGRDESRLSLLFRHHVAAKANLHPTDLECREIIISRRQITPGTLSRETGLSTGATTAMLKRLERNKLIQRTHSTHDRRNVFVGPILKNIEEIFALYEPFVADATTLLDRYSVHELEIIHSHYRAMAEIYETQIKTI